MFKVLIFSSDPAVLGHELESTYPLAETFRQAWDMFADPQWDRFDRFEVIDETGPVVRSGSRPKF